MKTTRILSASGAALLSTVLLVAFAPSAQATTFPDLGYNVTLNLGSIESNGNGLFSLDFQLVTGSGNVANTVTLSNFSFVGGSPSGTPNYTGGSETGSMVPGGTIKLTNGTANFGDNEIAEAFSAGVTQISFHVDETPNSEVVGSGTAIPDQFNVFLDDNTGYSIPTTDPSGGDSLVSSDLGSNATLATVETFSSTSPDAGVTVVLAAPEPSSGVLGLVATCGMLGLVLMRRRNIS